MLMKYRCANNANYKVKNIIVNTLVLQSIMYAEEIHGGTWDPSNFLLANNCSFLQLFIKSGNTDYLNYIFLYWHPRWETVTNREMAKSLEKENGHGKSKWLR